MNRKWSDLRPDPMMLEALERAGPRPFQPDARTRGAWNVRFAESCARMFAQQFRKDRAFKGLEIRPEADGSGKDELTKIGGRGRRRVGVIASTLATGPQVALSIKVESYSSPAGTYGKNLTTRMFELEDEVRAIHSRQPYAYVAALFFLPLAATNDRAGVSTFARTVAALRAHSGRLDRGAPTQSDRLDWSVIGLYVVDGVEGGPAEGVVRYFDVDQAPPRKGRPLVETTMGLSELAWRIGEDCRRDGPGHITYADAERD